ncbi:MAG TPA: hypothetical protein VIJ42_01620 [Stellaceae bacterium]
MAEGGRDIVAHEALLARRLVRLFRIERSGQLSRRPRDLVARLLQRRGELIDALIRTDAARRGLKIPITVELQRAAEALWRETTQSWRSTDARLQQLRADLLMARGEGIPSGIRGHAGGRVIGRV